MMVLTVYASHVVEHLDYAGELQTTLKEWHRVLAPRGQVLISVPDLDVLAGLMVEKDKLSVDQRFHVMPMLFGGHVDRYDYDVVGLNEDFLASFLGQAGFSNIRKVPELDRFEDTSGMVFSGVAISLTMIADKSI